MNVNTGKDAGLDEDAEELAKSGVSVDEAGISEDEMIAEPAVVISPGTGEDE